NPKWLNDDYVKFLRFAQWRIERTGYGILAFITNHGYLDNPTFRGMRRSLMQSFDDIYLLDLHGNSKKKEHAPDGSADENVFDIQQGVAIGIFIKHRKREGQDSTVHHADLWGPREAKYGWLSAYEVTTTSWTTLAPQTPSYLFIPQDKGMAEEYEHGWKLTDMMAVNSVGLYTARDDLVIQWTGTDVEVVLKDFASLEVEAARGKYNLGPDSRDWQVALAQKDVRAFDQSKIQPISYRPFDTRFTYYTGNSRGIACMPRPEVMRHMLHEGNLAICFIRRSREQITSNFLAANHIVDKTILSAADNANVAPLYLYPSETRHNLWEEELPTIASGGRSPNLAPAFVEDCSARLGLTWVSDGKGDRQQTFGPEDVFAYLYAIFHSPTYRERYAEFLKTDFPRLPLTSDVSLFHNLCTLGDELVRLHLLEQQIAPITRYPVPGNNQIETVRYVEPAHDAEHGRVWVNATQYVEGVAPEVWAFQIGGYQVCQKWLKDRKGHTLSYDDLTHYQQIIAALARTIDLMEQIDATIEEHGGWPLVGSSREAVPVSAPVLADEEE
ncbi:MAG TPA: type ISP restriction/modification enzyme, partial [Ktedonobacteraceae bacterium]